MSFTAHNFTEEFKTGHKAEDLFKKLMQDIGYVVTESTKEENIKDHIDFHLKFPPSDNGFSVDVKAQKKVNRSDYSVENDWVWIEFKNVRGAFGWLHGKATKIAFEREEDFLMVDTEKLKEFTFERVENIDVDRAYEAKYKFYSRRGRDDLLTQISMKDLMEEVEYELINKEC